MNVRIQLAHKKRYLSVLRAIYAITEPFTHERNDLTFLSDDEQYVLHIRTDISYVSFGPADQIDRPPYWTENIGYGEVERLFCHFMWGKYEELRQYRWMSNEP
jgi:hypothetical protein